jgi:hypothetical protein
MYTKTKFAVISYDDNQQQTFIDIVCAITPDDAKSIVGEQRPYCNVIAIALSAKDLSLLIEQLT